MLNTILTVLEVLLWYVLSGLIIILLTAIIHIKLALHRGYRKVLEYWNNHIQDITIDKKCVLMCLLGLLIWPIRIIQFKIHINNLYYKYLNLENDIFYCSKKVKAK